MPQMAPMSWTTLYMMFTAIFLLTMTISFFQTLHNKKSKSKSKIKIHTNWKW
uniref:ATP synthase complex subunit 8 n=1 Tax=Scolytinae sp. BMNH 1039905 TaxID=1903769 RepID=A0A343A5R4_9CUCU|nr:ATP synthase F0 subunit 8 [Scolytinae sp. BMNH 1039905]